MMSIKRCRTRSFIKTQTHFYLGPTIDGSSWSPTSKMKPQELTWLRAVVTPSLSGCRLFEQIWAHSRCQRWHRLKTLPLWLNLISKRYRGDFYSLQAYHAQLISNLTLSVRGAFKNGRTARGLHPPEQRVPTSQHWLAIYRHGYP